MDKNEFIEKFERVQDYYRKCVALGDALHDTLLNGTSVVCLGDTLCEAYLEMLAELSQIDFDTLNWLLYEGGGNCYKDGYHDQAYNVITAGGLWDFYKND